MKNLTVAELQAKNKELKPLGKRICPRCRELLSLKKFNAKPYRCKECVREAARDWASRHREYYREASRRHRAEAKELGPIYFLFAGARCRAKRNRREFSIGYDDFTPLPEFCPALGLKLNYDSRGKLKDDSPTLDRIDNSRGYVPGNVAVVSWRANRLKLGASAAELDRIASWMRARGVG